MFIFRVHIIISPFVFLLQDLGMPIPQAFAFLVMPQFPILLNIVPIDLLFWFSAGMENRCLEMKFPPAAPARSTK